MGALVAGTIYRVTSDGFVSYNTVQGGSAQIVEFLSDFASPPITVIGHDHGDWGAASTSHCFPVKNNEFWKITLAGGATIQNLRWMPIGKGVCNP